MTDLNCRECSNESLRYRCRMCCLNLCCTGLASPPLGDTPGSAGAAFVTSPSAPGCGWLSLGGGGSGGMAMGAAGVGVGGWSGSCFCTEAANRKGKMINAICANLMNSSRALHHSASMTSEISQLGAVCLCTQTQSHASGYSIKSDW